MNRWFKLALFAFIGVVTLNLILNLFFTPVGYGNYGNYNSMSNGYNMPMHQQMPMHNGQMMRGTMR